ncbi:MAG: TraX protein [Clostridiales bacterium]|nr:TraX protein [Clostridiales bacterium]
MEGNALEHRDRLDRTAGSGEKASLSGRGISGSALKVIAVISMLIDHTSGHVLAKYEWMYAPLLEFQGHKLTWMYILRNFIGRLAFPIFCFLLVEGFLHTRSRLKYALNLGIFAILSEIPWNLLHGGSVLNYKSQSVFFTLLFGLLGIWALEYFEKEKAKSVLIVVGLLMVSSFAHADYGAKGYGLILAIYGLRNSKLLTAVVGSALTSWRAGIAFIPISLYNGERGFVRGKVLKYAFYAIYPVHMLVLYLIKRGGI